MYRTCLNFAWLVYLPAEHQLPRVAMQNGLFLDKQMHLNPQKDISPGLVRGGRHLFPSLRPVAATLQLAAR